MTTAMNELNIYSKSKDPRGRLLSNFAVTPFELDGIQIRSLEGMLQGIKFPEGDARREQAFGTAGLAAKVLGRKATWTGMVFWNGSAIEFGSDEHRALLIRGLEAKFAQCAEAREALLATGDLTLVHRLAVFARRKKTSNPSSSTKTSLPNAKYCEALMAIRSRLRSSASAV